LTTGALFSLVLLLSGCQSATTYLGGKLGLGPDAELKHVITLHAVATRAEFGTSLGKEIALSDGRTVRVRRVPLITSASFVAGTVVGEGTHRKLRLQLSSHGEHLWLQACAQCAGDHVAIVIDGRYRGFLSMPTPTGTDTILIPGWGDDSQLEEIARQVAVNYARIKN
jgi:hypothetical protein